MSTRRCRTRAAVFPNTLWGTRIGQSEHRRSRQTSSWCRTHLLKRKCDVKGEIQATDSHHRSLGSASAARPPVRFIKISAKSVLKHSSIVQMGATLFCLHAVTVKHLITPSISIAFGHSYNPLDMTLYLIDQTSIFTPIHTDNHKIHIIINYLLIINKCNYIKYYI